MKNTLILGLLRGDEGKGKITDYFSNKHDVVVRYAGGPNAGHSIYRNGNLFVTHSIPSGIFDKKICIIGRGCVVNIKKLYKEFLDLMEFIKNNYSINEFNPCEIKSLIKLSYAAHVITDEHILEDTNRENAGMGNGSTKQGISPAYRDKYYRVGKRIIDIINNVEFQKDYSSDEISFINDIMFDEEKYINTHEKYNYLFEGAQGVLLDIDNPYYPNVSSSSVGVGGIITGTGISYKNLMNDFNVVGVVKSYMSSVGVGKFLTEIKGEFADKLRSVGQEYGATTGRPRKVGWLDIPLINYSIRTTGVDVLCLTRLDTLRESFSEYGKIYICTSYKNKNKIEFINTANLYNLDEYEPIYEEIPIWKEESLNDEKFVNFLNKIEYLTKTRVKYISIGKDKDSIIER